MRGTSYRKNSRKPVVKGFRHNSLQNLRFMPNARIFSPFIHTGAPIDNPFCFCPFDKTFTIQIFQAGKGLRPNLGAHKKVTEIRRSFEVYYPTNTPETLVVTGFFMSIF